ncbi:MAG TPA: hypothetical protein VHF26_03210, partial [Trebonia sp.]|nr:hypothetical protein [Trebonia sp.]
MRAVVLAVAVWATVGKTDLPGWQLALSLLGLVAASAAVWLYFRCTLRHLLWPSVGLIVLLLAGAGL